LRVKVLMVSRWFFVLSERVPEIYISVNYFWLLRPGLIPNHCSKTVIFAIIFGVSQRVDYRKSGKFELKRRWKTRIIVGYNIVDRVLHSRWIFRNLFRHSFVFNRIISLFSLLRDSVYPQIDAHPYDHDFSLIKKWDKECISFLEKMTPRVRRSSFVSWKKTLKKWVVTKIVITEM